MKHHRVPREWVYVSKDMEQHNWFQIGKGVRQAVCCPPAYLTSMQSTSRETLGWRKHKLESRLTGEISITSDMQMTPPYGRKWNQRASWKWKRRVKSWLKIQHSKKPKIMASGPITSWQIDGETVETVTDFILGGSKITADGECSHEIKKRLLLRRKVMTNLDSILKSRDITFQQRSV